jgi:uncharacterized membrane protein
MMPTDAIVLSVAVVAVFVAFAVVLYWADLQTRPDRLKADSNSQNAAGRRSAIGR